MKKSSKILLSVCALFVLLAALAYIFLFNTIGIVTKTDNETVISVSASGKTIAAVVDSGDVYVKGEITSDYNYGMNRILQYNHLYADQFARIYDKKDAVSVNLSESGGCIVTNQSDVYVFVNGSEKYKIPTYLCSGYIKAYLAGDDIYLLCADGRFGFVNIEKPDDFTVLGSNVIDFDVEYSDSIYPYGICFALTENNRLYASELGKALHDNEQYIDDVIGFDVIAFCADLTDDDTMKKYVEVSLLDSDYHAYWFEGDLDKDFSRIIDKKNYTVTGSDIHHVVSFPRGIAMLNQEGEVVLYGYDFWHEDFFTGETVFTNVETVFSGNNHLIILYKNGVVDYYGYDYYRGTNSYITH